jgi:hypothetical protein
MDSAKKRTFHHSKPAEDDEEDVKKVKPQDEDELDPLDDEDSEEENPKATKREEDEEEQEESPKSASDDEPGEDENTNGPKINFDYPPKVQEEDGDPEPEEEQHRPMQADHPANLDDLAGEGEEENTGPTVSQMGAQKRFNPYSDEPQQQPEEEDMNIPHIQRQNQSQNPYGNLRDPGGRMGQSAQARMDNNFGNYAPGNNFQFKREGNYRSNRSSKMYFILLVVVALAVLGGAIYLLKHQLSPAKVTPSPTPKVEISTPAPSPTQAPLDRSKYTLRVLNGTGKTGLAGTVADKLKTLGYKIDKTGNATQSAVPQTVVRTKSDGTDLGAQLVKDLSDQQLDATTQANLKSTETVDSEIIIGNK